MNNGVANQPIIHNMGKVGSIAVQIALKKTHNIKTIHAHSIMHEGQYITDKPILIKAVKNKDSIRNWTVITLVRDPIARNLSSFFRGIQKYALEYRRATNEDFRKAFEKNFKHGGRDLHRLGLRWFDEEIKALYGIDVYKDPYTTLWNKKDEFENSPRWFPPYRVYQNKKTNVELLILRTEDLTKYSAVAFKYFMNLDNVVVYPANTTAEKNIIGEIYTKFLKEPKLSPKFVERMYRSKLAKEFYSPEELESFTKKWTGD
jgi:hypothetical protein